MEVLKRSFDDADIIHPQYLDVKYRGTKSALMKPTKEEDDWNFGSGLSGIPL